MIASASSSEIRATLWPKRLMAIRQSLNRSSRMIVVLGLLAMCGNTLWVWQDRRQFSARFDLLEISTWYHPAYLNSILIAIIILYAMRQVSRTRQKLNPLGYPLLERQPSVRGVEAWHSVDPLSRRPVDLYVFRPDKFHGEPKAWKRACELWMRRAEKLRRLTSPHVVPVIDFGLAQGDRFYAAFELRVGMNVKSFVEQHGPCPPDRAVFLLAQVAHALDDAHRNGLTGIPLDPMHIDVGHRSSNEDWIHVQLFAFHDTGEAPSTRRDDILNFVKLAIGLLTGKWIPGDEPLTGAPSTEESVVAIPYGIRLVLEHVIHSGGEAPPLTAAEITQRMWSSLPGPMWTNDRAASWWKEHGDRTVSS